MKYKIFRNINNFININTNTKKIKIIKFLVYTNKIRLFFNPVYENNKKIIILYLIISYKYFCMGRSGL